VVLSQLELYGDAGENRERASKTTFGGVWQDKYLPELDRGLEKKFTAWPILGADSLRVTLIPTATTASGYPMRVCEITDLRIL
jgi:hypothetical protein